jgi:predicted SnoaL-like aldol condensation-catalyzing enzyme
MSEDSSKSVESPGGLSLELARELFERMDADEAAADYSIVEQYYHEDVRFRDPIQSLQGRDAFIEMTENLVRRCSQLSAHVNDAAQTGDVIFLQWTMEMKIGPTPLTAIEGTTRLRLDADGRVVEHRDYFDFWGDAMGAIPGVGSLYRRFMRMMG